MAERLGVDIGGTFVDSIVYKPETEEFSIEKTHTIPDDPEQGVINGIREVNVDLPNTDTLVHGTTLGINAYLEREGANTGIITNQGFKDVYEIGRYNLPPDEWYNFRYTKPESLVPRRRRIGVLGRVSADGEVIEPLNEGEVRAASDYLVEEVGVDSFAVCFLHSYRNPDHEQRVAEILNERYPAKSVSISSDIAREYREYERTSTAVIDAYIKPIFESYVDELSDFLSEMGFDGDFFITRSGGGAISAENAKQSPVQTILSGPAGGLIGTTVVGENLDREELIAIDMGGTSLDACVVEGGSPAIEYQSSLDDHPLMIPVYDIRTIGAGGGSIAWLDGDLLRVGPKSAGADPGPMCYGRGGTEPTVTDAALVLGYLDADEFLGGEMSIDIDSTYEGIETKLAEPLGASLVEVCKGVFEVTLANTVSAVREITVEKGLDPREFSMVGYGGAGPMFVPLVAREMSVPEVVIPNSPSVFSALGMLMADVVYDFSRTHTELLRDIEMEQIEEIYGELEQLAEDRLIDEGFTDGEDRTVERVIEMRYHGQEHSVGVQIEGLPTRESIASAFEQKHEERYGHSMDDPPEMVHLRVRGIGHADNPEHHRGEIEEGSAQAGVQEAYCFAEDGFVDFDIYRRAALEPNAEIEGPAIIREPTTTIVIHSDQMARVDELGYIMIDGGRISD